MKTILSALLCGIMALSGAAQTAREARPPVAAAAPSLSVRVDTDARALLETMARTHRDLQSYFARVEIRTTNSGVTKIENGVVAFQKPSKAKIEMVITDKQRTGTRFLLSDGTSFYTGDTATGGWNREKLPDSKSGALKVVERGGVGSGLLRSLMTDANAAALLVPSYVESLTIEPESLVDGVSCQVVKMVIPGSLGGAPGTAVFYIGKSDALLRRLTLQHGNSKYRESSDETYKEVQANPVLPAALFVFAPSAGLREIKPVPSLKSLRVPVRTRGK